MLNEIELQVKEVLHPTMSEQAAALYEKNERPLDPAPVHIEERPVKIPLSFNQERLWFLDQMDGSLAYHIPAVFRLKGELNKEAVGYSFRQIVNRHEILRTCIREENGQPYQFVLDRDKWQLVGIDGTGLDSPAEVNSLLSDLINKPFDLSEDHPLRVSVINLSKNENVFVLTLHHIASDRWSTSIIVREFVQWYNAVSEGKEPVFEPLDIQYADFTIWQRQLLQGEVLDKKLSYWKNKLEGLEPLQLHTDFPRPKVQSSNGDVRHFSLDKELSDSLTEFSRQNGVTLYMTLLSAFKVLLYRYSGQQDVCVGTVVAGRGQLQIEGLVGFFANTLALRSNIDGSASYMDILQLVKTTTVEDFRHQDVPFEKVVEAVVKERDLSRSPLFQVLFVLQNKPDKDLFHLGEVEVWEEPFGTKIAKFEIDFSLVETSDGLQGQMEYNSDLYHGVTIDRLLAHYKNLLRSIIENPGQKAGVLPMLDKSEKAELLFQFNGPSGIHPENKSIVSLFEEQVIKSPEKVAVISGNEKITYRQLNERANQLAHYLISRGVKSETLIPLFIERSFEMIIGILGILKSGAAYVPIDPSYPMERITFMLEDTASGIVLSSGQSRAKLPQTEGLDVIEVSDQSITISRHNPEFNIQHSQLAYVIYTSGSTGKPKGVMIEHGSVYWFISWCQKEFSTEKFEIVYATTSMCFDLSVFEFFFPLSIGKSIRILQSGLDLTRRFEGDEQVLINTVPVVIENLLRQEADVGNITVINMAGEPISPYVQKHLDLEKIQVRNLYGPTEDTTYSSVLKLKKGEVVSIGKPIANTSIRIVNTEGSLVPVGVAGEICISGSGLARGYHNRPELTAQRFIVDNINDETPVRIYKTGDMGRWLPDGNIDYLGRVDGQVKIRGYRVELGEIEALLEQSGMFKSQVVLAKQDANGNKNLVGYVVPGSVAFDKKEIIGYLQKRLPEFMVPHVWVELQSLPLTQNGKIDRKALPDPDITKLLESQYAVPKNPTEAGLVNIWKALLGLEKLGTRDNFFELGGNSIQAVSMFNRIRKRFGKSLPITTLIKAATIEKLAAILIENVEISKSALVPIQPSGSNPPLFCVHGGRGDVLFYLDLANTLGTTQPLYALRARGLRGEAPFDTCVEDMASHYIEEIRKLQPDGPYYLAGYCFGGVVAFEMAQQLLRDGLEVSLLTLINGCSPTYTHGQQKDKEQTQEKPGSLPFLSRHSNKFSHLGIFGKISYLLMRGINRVRRILLFIYFKLRVIVLRSFFTLKKRIYHYYVSRRLINPRIFGYHYLFYENNNMARRYKPKSYPGKVIIFHSSHIYSDPHLGWSDFLSGEIESFDVPGDYKYRNDVLREPYVKFLASKLKCKLLAEAE